MRWKEMYRIQTGGRWLVKGGEQKVVGDALYKPEDINGWYSPAHRVVVKNTKTGDQKVYFPGDKIKVTVPRKKAKKD